MPKTDLPRPVFIMLVTSIVLLAANMRAPIASLGSIAPVIQQALTINQAQLGWLGSVPVIMFAFGAFISPKLSKRFSIANLLLSAIILLTVGIVLRVLIVDWWIFLLGTIILSFAIGLANTLAAPAIKLYTPNHIPLITGILSLTMTVVAGVATGVILPLNDWLGWQWALGCWALLSLPAIALWWLFIRLVNQELAKQESAQEEITQKKPSHKEDSHPNQSEPASQPLSVWHAPLAWHIAIYMGLQSLTYYTFASFLPSILTAKGLSLITAGQVATIFFIMAPLAIIFLTWWMRRFESLITVVAVFASFCNFIGCVGIAYLSIELAWLWAGLIGFGGSVIFTLAFMLITMRTYTTQQASELSGMSQTIGYCIAFFGPIGTGWLHEISGNWQIPLNLLILLMVISMIFAYLASRNVMIDGQKIQPIANTQPN